MKVIDILLQSRSVQLSFELLPPLKGGNIQSVFDTVERLAPYAPAYINITYHRRQELPIVGPNGQLQTVRLRRRAGTIGVAAAIQNRYKIDVVPHIICADADRAQIEDELIDLDFLGFDNILALRGDADRAKGRFEPRCGGHANAEGLVRQIADMNRGLYLDREVESPQPTGFCVGVAGYPETHAEAQSPEADLAHLRRKVEAGAHYVVTQMFFDNARYFSFVERCRQEGINVPIIPGIKPISVRKHLTMLPRTFGIAIPPELSAQVERCRSNAEVYELGVEWAVAQCQELKRAGVPAIHFYTMGRPDNVARIAERVF